MPPRTIRIAVLVAACAALSPRLRAQDADAFDQAYAAARGLMQKGRWQDAKVALDAALGQHERQLYVLAQKDAIVADAGLCAFWAKTTVPRAQDLLSGRVESYQEKTGKIKLRYTSDTMADWRDNGQGLLVHPLVFAGTYSVTITGKSYPQDDSIRFVFGLGDSGYYIADFGAPQFGRQYIDMALRRARGDEKPSVIASRSSLATPHEAYTAQVKVKQRSVEMLFNKKSGIKAEREDDELGQLAVLPGSFDEILIDGEIEPSWFQGLVDQRLAAQREEFAMHFQPQSALPAWLFEEPKVERVEAKELFDSTHAKSAKGRAVFADIARGELDAALQRLAECGDGDLTPGDRAFLTGLSHHRRGDDEAALPFAQQARKELPEATRTLVLEATVLDAMRRRREALPLLQQAVAGDPGDAEATEALFVALMRQNDVAGATKLVRDAKCRYGMWAETQELDAMLAMRARGPSWPKRYSYRSEHYEIYSDIDAKLCFDASMILENAYVNLKAQLAWVKDDPKQERFQVYLFAGEGGYQEYNKHILGSAKPHTAGLYSPVLKQLLIWNVPKREDMERTIRHEGFHQFLDRAIEDPPVWFNEGAAEFWETARREKGSLQGGQVRGDHIATLVRSRKLIPALRDFVYGSRADFYANAQQRYAQGWALVHFLRKGNAAKQKIWKTLWDSLRSPDLSTRQALDAAFAGADWGKLEAEFWDYLGELKK